MKQLSIIAMIVLVLSGCRNETTLKSTGQSGLPGKIAVPATAFAPKEYICYRAGQVNVDGNITDEEWSGAPWTDKFTDIEGDLKPAPLYDTRVKMMWDDNWFYIAAELYEPDVMATLKQRDTIIFHDNDFEVFIDPDGDTHGYYEFEMNAYNTLWDLLLTMPYRDFGQVIDAWDIKGLKSAVKIYGTINNPADRDEKWTVELAFPMEVMKEWGNLPSEGTQWRVNFSRVNWKMKVVDGKYVKETDPLTGKPLPEFNWLWSPQGLINVHYPEMWGFVQFSMSDGKGSADKFVTNSDEAVKWDLRKLYYAQRAFAEANGKYSSDAASLSQFGYTPAGIAPEIIVTMAGYEASLPSTDGKNYVCINSLGRTWKTGSQPEK